MASSGADWPLQRFPLRNLWTGLTALEPGAGLEGRSSAGWGPACPRWPHSQVRLPPLASLILHGETSSPGMMAPPPGYGSRWTTVGVAWFQPRWCTPILQSCKMGELASMWPERHRVRAQERPAVFLNKFVVLCLPKSAFKCFLMKGAKIYGT